jgi:sulfur oxidation c-type cytochrome SoxA
MNHYNHYIFNKKIKFTSLSQYFLGCIISLSCYEVCANQQEWQLNYQTSVQDILKQGQSDWQQLINIDSVLKGGCTLQKIKQNSFHAELDLEGKIIQCFLLSGIDKNKIEQEYRQSSQGRTSKITAIVSYLKAIEPMIDLMSFNLRSSLRSSLKNDLNARIQKGKELFYQRSGQLDLSCAICHTKNNDKQTTKNSIFHQMRLIAVPNFLDKKQAYQSISSWPAYRVEKSVIWTMQKRINECQKQMRVEAYTWDSQEIIALSDYMTSLYVSKKKLKLSYQKIKSPEDYIFTNNKTYLPVIKR